MSATETEANSARSFVDCAFCGCALLMRPVPVHCDDCAEVHQACDVCATSLVPQEEGFDLAEAA